VSENLYFSVSAIPGFDIQESFNLLREAGISNIEVSVGTKPGTESNAVLQREIDNGAKLLWHHNIPIDNKYNFINLCEKFDERLFAKIFQWCQKSGARHFSVHGGLYNEDLLTRSQAMDKFAINYNKAVSLGKTFGIRMGIETAYPTLNGSKYVLDSENDIKTFVAMFPDTGLVLDFAHVKIQKNFKTAEESLIDFMLASENLIEVHISENNGVSDSHTQILRASKFWDKVKSRSELPIVIEGKLFTAKREVVDKVSSLKDNYNLAGEMIYG
jgi:endonuclease IV